MNPFHVDFYDRYRPLYPFETYAGLPWSATALDLGGGTGQSGESLRRAVQGELHVLDPDAAMLAHARARLPGAIFHHAPAELIPLPDMSIDLVTIASAFHWMDGMRVREECKRVLRPGGLLLIYEYQFPKCSARPELNEWIRRQFNQLWKAPAQVPRGNFRDAVLAPIKSDPTFALVSEGPVPMRLSLSFTELHGLILSQSRYLHYERTLTGAAEIAAERARVWEELNARLTAADVFDFALSRALFKKSRLAAHARP